MNIYIYGDKSFKSEVNDLINHSNLRLYLDKSSHIEEIDSVEALKMAIEEEPEHIYLIDNDKIIKPNSINSKINFLKPKGGIEEEFLEEHGVLDSKFETMDDLIKDLKDKFQEKKDNPSTRTDSSFESNYPDVQNDSNNYNDEEYSFNNSIDYGEFEGLERDDEIEDTEDSNTFEFDDLDFNKEDNNDSNQLQEYYMAENIDDIENISEEAMLNALNNMDDIDISSIQTASQKTAVAGSSASDEINLSGSNMNANEIASLISQLLSNKTLEITIKVKS